MTPGMISDGVARLQDLTKQLPVLAVAQEMTVDKPNGFNLVPLQKLQSPSVVPMIWSIVDRNERRRRGSRQQTE